MENKKGFGVSNEHGNGPYKSEKLNELAFGKNVLKDKEGNDIEDHYFYSVFTKLTEYENKKLEHLKEYPFFNDHIKQVRNELEIDISYEDSRLAYYRDYYECTRAQGDSFIKKVAYIFDTFSEYIADNELNYKTICYYIVFKRILTEFYFRDFIFKATFVKNDIEETIEEQGKLINFLKSIPEFNDSIEQIRYYFAIIENDSPEYIAYTYNRFNQYMYKYYLFEKRKDKFHINMYQILTRYEFLNVNNRLDYLLIYNYLINNKLLPDNYLKDIPKSAIIEFYKGIDFVNNEEYDHSSLYAKIPTFFNKEYFKNIFPLILSEATQHYNLVDSESISKLNKKEQFRYYRNKFIYEFMESIEKDEDYRSMSSLDQDLFIRKKLEEVVPDFISKHENWDLFSSIEQAKRMYLSNRVHFEGRTLR